MPTALLLALVGPALADDFRTIPIAYEPGLDGFCTGQGLELLAADLDGDGYDDLVCHDPDTGIDSISLAVDAFQGTSLETAPWCGGDDWKLKLGDFNGDGKADRLCSSASQGVVAISSTDEAGPHDWTDQWTWWCSADVYVGDIDGTGTDDLVCHDPGTGQLWLLPSYGGALDVWSTLVPPYDGWCAGPEEEVYVADLDSGGTDDLICFDRSTGLVSADFGELGYESSEAPRLRRSRRPWEGASGWRVDSSLLESIDPNAAWTNERELSIAEPARIELDWGLVSKLRKKADRLALDPELDRWHDPVGTYFLEQGRREDGITGGVEWQRDLGGFCSGPDAELFLGRFDPGNGTLDLACRDKRYGFVQYGLSSPTQPFAFRGHEGAFTDPCGAVGNTGRLVTGDFSLSWGQAATELLCVGRESGQSRLWQGQGSFGGLEAQERCDANLIAYRDTVDEMVGLYEEGCFDPQALAELSTRAGRLGNDIVATCTLYGGSHDGTVDPDLAWGWPDWLDVLASEGSRAGTIPTSCYEPPPQASIDAVCRPISVELSRAVEEDGPVFRTRIINGLAHVCQTEDQRSQCSRIYHRALVTTTTNYAMLVVGRIRREITLDLEHCSVDGQPMFDFSDLLDPNFDLNNYN